MKTFKKLLEDIGVPSVSPTNTIKNVAGLTGDPPIQPTKKKRPIIGNLFRRKKLNG